MAVGHVRMTVPEPFVPMRVAVRVDRHHVVEVNVMAVIVAVRMLVFERFMFVLVTVRFRQVECQARQTSAAASQPWSAGPSPCGEDRASSAARGASSFSISDAAVATSRGRSGRASPASARCGRRDSAPTVAAPAYSSAAVANAPTPAPNHWTSGVLTPNSAAASRASRPLRSAGRGVRRCM